MQLSATTSYRFLRTRAGLWKTDTKSYRPWRLQVAGADLMPDVPKSIAVREAERLERLLINTASQLIELAAVLQSEAGALIAEEGDDDNRDRRAET